MELNDYSKRNTEPQEYNPLRMPSLFTELDPAGLKEVKDEHGNVLSEFEAGARALLSGNYKGGHNFDKVDKTLDTGAIMKGQAAGDFRLSRSAYLQLLKACKDGDMTYVRMRKNRLGRQTNVIFFGANLADGFPSKNLYKALNVAKPDLVMVQLSPDYLLNDFN